MLKTIFKILFWLTLTLCLLAAAAGGGALYYFIVLQPGDEIRAENINAILGKESPVLYSDGKTRLGVFFDSAHRQYVPYEKIPVNFINALVASEDNRFFSHIGFDVFGILRAAKINIQAGRVVQGGSTLTQQTAKNLFKRKNRSFQAKLKELLFALRLEYHYSKERIFEFYANQFYVSGNGHGLGVAARYYFNKKPEELTLLECAYIAGSVKRPNYYNPFLKKTEEAEKTALKRGKQRVNYVLSKMLELHMISEYQYSLAKVSDVQFSKGQVGYSLDYAMEMVKDAVASEEITSALAEREIDNISTSGVRIITTVKKNLQEKILYSLRHDLSRLDVRLRGYEREEVQKELQALNYNGDSDAREYSFVFGIIKEIDQQELKIYVDLGRNKGDGIITKNGLKRMVDARVKWQKNPWAETSDPDYDRFLDQLLVGDMVWVSVLGHDDKGIQQLELEKFPELNGGALVLRDGRILAVTGGVENRFFNRAIYGKRTMGSSFKPFVFAAALQLGWNSTDPLRNTREVFVFQNQPYFPRPDHNSPHAEVSLSWAGVHSENVASVWLLSRLCDKLSSAQFREVAANVGVAPRVIDGEVEPYSRFSSRIRDTYGIVINLDILRHAAFKQAITNVETDLIFVGRDVDYQSFQNLHYGLGFSEFREDIKKELETGGADLRKSVADELRLRLRILQNSYLDLESLQKGLHDYKNRIMALDPDFPSSLSLNQGYPSDNPGMNLYYNNFQQRYVFSGKKSSAQPLSTVNPISLRRYLATLDESALQLFWDDVYLADSVSAEGFGILRKQLTRELNRLKEDLPYSMEVLETIPDYRMLVGLRFLISFARELGINSDLQPVLSFPLGSNVVTLLETLRVYEALATGDVWITGNQGESEGDLLSIIDRIESDEGEILYQPERKKKMAVAPETSLAIGHILENTVKFGTGRYADRNVKLKEKGEDGKDDSFASLDLSIPVLGKTGTANRYTNASFFGFLPALDQENDSLTIEDGFAVGVYVGFDDNKEMRKGATRIAGSAGALPTWSEIVNSVVDEEKYIDSLDPVELSFNGLSLERMDVGQKNMEADTSIGGRLSNAREISSHNRYHPSILTFGEINEEGVFDPARHFLPFWRVEAKE